MKRAFLTVGLGWGDESKGACVDFLCHRYNAGLVIRYSGGPQCGHNVVQPDGRHHTFQQFGAGMFHPGVRTHLLRFVLVNPLNQVKEEKHLCEIGIKDAWERTSIDPHALIVVPFHRELNRAMTPSGTNSCGQGIGVCREMHLKYGDKVLFAADLLDQQLTRTKLRFILDRAREQIPSICRGELAGNDFAEDVIDWCWDQYRDWRELVSFRESKDILTGIDTVVFEGAQGVLLDEIHGESGFNTWTDVTIKPAQTLLDEAGYDGERIKIGVTRTYYTRHGAGPFPTEDPDLHFPEPHNEDTGYQGKFRRGKFDDRLFRKAIDICGGIDWLALNHLDQQPVAPAGYHKWHNIFGYGPTYQDRMESKDRQ
jgi:adenylosuccinate synthase